MKNGYIFDVEFEIPPDGFVTVTVVRHYFPPTTVREHFSRETFRATPDRMRVIERERILQVPLSHHIQNLRNREMCK